MVEPVSSCHARPARPVASVSRNSVTVRYYNIKKLSRSKLERRQNCLKLKSLIHGVARERRRGYCDQITYAKFISPDASKTLLMNRA